MATQQNMQNTCTPTLHLKLMLAGPWTLLPNPLPSASGWPSAEGRDAEEAEELASSSFVEPGGSCDSWGLFCAAIASWNWPRRSMIALKPAKDSNCGGRQVG